MKITLKKLLKDATCTEQYLEDRGLCLYNWINRQDAHTAYNSAGTATRFFDADYANEWLKMPGSGIERTFYWGSEDGDDITNIAGPGDYHLYGEGGADTINGANGADHIEGGEGADTINGGDELPEKDGAWKVRGQAPIK